MCYTIRAETFGNEGAIFAPSYNRIFAFFNRPPVKVALPRPRRTSQQRRLIIGGRFCYGICLLGSMQRILQNRRRHQHAAAVGGIANRKPVSAPRDRILQDRKPCGGGSQATLSISKEIARRGMVQIRRARRQAGLRRPGADGWRKDALLDRTAALSRQEIDVCRQGLNYGLV